MKKGFNSAAGAVTDFKNQLLGLAAAAGVGLSVNALKNYVSSTIDAISESNALAQQVGFSAEAFQKLSYAARLSHVDQELLAKSLGQMSKRLGEVAIEGAGPAADVLKRFGVNAQALAAMGPEKAFGVILNIFQKIQNPMERSAVAMDLFGKAGQGMINLIAQGGPALEKMGEEASRLGFALNGVDNAKVIEAKHALIELSLAGEGFANMLAVKVAPFLTLVIEKYTEWAYQGTKSADFLARGIDIIVGSLGVAIDAVNVLSTAFYGIRSVVDKVVESSAASFAFLLDGVIAVVKSIADATKGWSVGLDAALSDIQTRITGFNDGVKSFRDNMEAAAKVDFSKAGASFNLIGKGGAQVRKLVDEIESEADKRGKIAADKKAAFINPGDLNPKQIAIGFASAGAEAGSKEAHSAVLASKGLQINAQAQMALDTKNTAENTGQTVAQLKAIHKTLSDKGAGGDLPATPAKI